MLVSQLAWLVRKAANQLQKHGCIFHFTSKARQRFEVLRVTSYESNPNNCRTVNRIETLSICLQALLITTIKTHYKDRQVVIKSNDNNPHQNKRTTTHIAARTSTKPLIFLTRYSRSGPTTTNHQPAIPRRSPHYYNKQYLLLLVYLVRHSKHSVFSTSQLYLSPILRLQPTTNNCPRSNIREFRSAI